MDMASEEQVKQYLAHWFQLGKQVLLPNRQEKLRPTKIFEGKNYSAEFERVWHYLLEVDADCYLEGTEQTIQQLLSHEWEIIECARCEMPFPITTAGVTSLVCPCSDLPGWPNNELPPPRSGVDSEAHLTRIRQRIKHSNDN